MDRYRLITSIVVLFVYLLAMYPLQTITTSIVLVIGYLILRNIGAVQTFNDSKTQMRRAALKEAKIYLSPYSNIWNNLKLSNKYCSLRLGSNGSIIARDKAKNRSFKVIESKVHSYDDLWNMFCKAFSYNTTFDGLVQLCQTFSVTIYLREENRTVVNNDVSRESNGQRIKVDVSNDIKEKLDINNASEVELTALPGISIVVAKKLIIKREEIGGFKSVNDVFLFLKLKPHMQTQLEKIICVKKIKGKIGLGRYNERTLDL